MVPSVITSTIQLVPLQAERMCSGPISPACPRDLAAVADLVIHCLERDLARSLELAADLAVQRLLVGLRRVRPELLGFPRSSQPSARPSAGGRRPAPGGVEKRLLGVQGIFLDQHALEIELTEQLLERCPLAVLAGGVAGLADRHA